LLLAAEVIMAVRNTSLGEKAAADIRAQYPSAKVMVMSCDLSSLQSVKQFAADFKKTGKPCHVLLANAGVMMCPFSLTADGHEMQFGTNHLGHFVLVSELLPVLKKTGTRDEPARVVVLSSASHFRWEFEAGAGTRHTPIGLWYEHVTWPRRMHACVCKMSHLHDLPFHLVQLCSAGDFSWVHPAEAPGMHACMGRP
jgi:NAD(P)-dependent dehydrogenase (short-subunit alcohol dehydrogenase family)